MAKHGEKAQTRGGGVVGRLQTRLKRYLALAAGFGLARAVTSNAYITAFGARFGDNLGFVADTTFSLLTNGLSVLLTLGLVVLAMRPARKPRLPIDGAGPLGHGIPLPLVFLSIVVLAIGYVMGAAGLFALLPSVVGEGVCALAYALGMIVLTLAWFEPFVFADDMRRSIRSLVGELPRPGGRVLWPVVSVGLGAERGVRGAAVRLRRAAGHAAPERGRAGRSRARSDEAAPLST